MSYNPQGNHLDFEIGSFGSFVKGAGKALGKVTDATITKPSAWIGGKIGGKRGRELGEKIGGFTSKVTTLGVGAGALGAAAGLAPLLAPIGVPVGTALLAKKALHGRKGGRSIASGMKHLFKQEKQSSQQSSKKSRHHKSRSHGQTDNGLAAQVAAMLVAKLGGPIDEANKALKLAELQREATYEHRKLMSDSDFRKAVLAGITKMAALGNQDCQRTIKVLVNR